MAKLSKPVLWLAIFGCLAVCYMVLNPGDPPPARKVKKTITASSSSDRLATYTPEDYKAKFPPLNTTVRNAFKPIVARVNKLDAPVGPTGIPSELTGGEANWTYTGSVEVDGVVQALLENPTTGEGEFVKVGDTWKKARVMQITGTVIVLQGPAGIAKTVKLQGTELTAPPVAAGIGVAPARVPAPLQGQIGTLSVQPDATGIGAPTGQPGVQNGQTDTAPTQPRRRGRRNGGSGGGGQDN
jgi:hypothetical protein